MKAKQFKWYVYLLMAVIIVIGSICLIRLVDIFSINSQEVGTAIVTAKDEQAAYTYDLGEIVLENTSGNTFATTYTLGAESFNGTDKHFVVEINSEPISNLSVKAGSLEFDYILKFKGLEGEELTTSTLHIRIDYLTSGTKIVLNMANNNNSVNFLTTHSELNGFVIKIYERS